MRTLSHVGIALAAILLVGITILIGCDIVARYLLASPIFGTQDIVKAALVAIIGFSLADAWIAGANVSMSMLIDRMPAPFQWAVRQLTALLGLVIGGSLAWSAGEAVVSSLRIGGSTPLLRIPYWPLSAALVLSALMLIGAVVYRMVRPLPVATTAAEHARAEIAATIGTIAPEDRR